MHKAILMIRNLAIGVAVVGDSGHCRCDDR